MILSLAGAISLITFCHFIIRRAKHTRLQLPPGPRGSLIFGVKQILPTIEPWKTYARWSEEFNGTPYLPGPCAILLNYDVFNPLLRRRHLVQSLQSQGCCFELCVSHHRTSGGTRQHILRPPDVLDVQRYLRPWKGNFQHFFWGSTPQAISENSPKRSWNACDARLPPFNSARIGKTGSGVASEPRRAHYSCSAVS
jgi:hypothetical protein